MSFMLSVTIKSIMLSVIMLNVVVLNVIMLNVVAPPLGYLYFGMAITLVAVAKAELALAP